MARLLGNTGQRINWALWIGLLVTLLILVVVALLFSSLVVPLLSH